MRMWPWQGTHSQQQQQQADPAAWIATSHLVSCSSSPHPAQTLQGAGTRSQHQTCTGGTNRARGSGTGLAQQLPECCECSTQPCNPRGLSCLSHPCPFIPGGFRWVLAPMGYGHRSPACYQGLPCTRKVPGAHQIALQD